MKFSFDPQNEGIILHNLPPEMRIQIIINDSENYSLEDVFEIFEFRGNKIVVKWLADDDEINECEDYGFIRSILRRAWNWYRSQVFIEKYTPPAGAMEDADYILQPSKLQQNSWILTDKNNLISISFENHRFNDTQKITNLNDFSPSQIAMLPTILRKMGDWLAENHRDKIF